MQKKELERLEAAQNRIRQQTAQDFHDEIGNKITRINLLTLMAEKKAADNEELLTVLKQIRNNTQMLYSGAKDVIWSLQKDSDYLKEALLHIEQNAIALLNDTGIIVRIEESAPIKNDILMPIDYGRNLMLIFKEAINNALKYSGADLLLLRFYEDIDNSIVLELEDNGKGFDVLNADYGNGLSNMRTRAENIKAKFSIQSKAGQGTLIRLRMFPYSFQ
ncbi:MAG TPA: ATP-binding protein [Edaphocola sp.]|nr:ATP-binding protein [Edaphocola sp.]